MNIISKVREAIKRVSSVPASRVSAAMMNQWSPLEFMTPVSLSAALRELKAGDPRQFSNLWDDARVREDMLSSVEPKRRKDVSRIPWEITSEDDNPEAERQKEILKYFFKNLRCTDLLDSDKTGSVSALIRGMMLAVGYGHSVHEIIWKPSPSGLAAEFRQMPLQFFERRSGKMRYLPSDGAYNGIDLDDGGWLVTGCDDKLGIASLVLYLFKHMPLRDWLIYCDRYAIPGLHGKTTAQKGSGDWNSLRDALLSFGQDWALLTGQDATVTPVDISAKGQLPYPPLIERCDRRMSGLWRGGDLSSMSSTQGQGTGSNMQEGETDILLVDDVMMCEEAINTRIVPYVLRYTLGTDQVLASFRLQQADEQTESNLKVDTFLIDRGVGISKNYLREKYGRPTPDAGDELAQPSAQQNALPAIPGAPGGSPVPAAPAAETVADTAMNGAQVQSLVEIVSKVAQGEIPLSVAPSIIKAAFPMLTDDRIKMMIPTSDQIKVPAPETAPAPNAETNPLASEAVAAVLSALDKDLAPVRDRIQAALDLPDDQMIKALSKLRDEMPALFRSISDAGILPSEIEMKLAQAFASGIKGTSI
jgi:phage gp29-like protein